SCSAISGVLSRPFLAASSATTICIASWSTIACRVSGVSGRPWAAPCLAIASTVRWLIVAPFTVAAAGPVAAAEPFDAGAASFAELHAARASIDAMPARRIAYLMGLISFLGWLGPFEISANAKILLNVPAFAPRNL